jgi:hypothetical protein
MKNLPALLLGFTLAVLALWVPQLVGQQAPPTTQHTWEYASVGISRAGISITTPDRTLSASEWPELIAKYTGKKAPETAYPQDAINLLGRDGWELVTTVNSNDRTEWWYKRTGR